MTPTGDYYRLLQVDPSADQEIVEAAYRRLARKYHPDLNAGDDAGAVMRQLNEAYAVLRDPTRRAAYDRERDKRARAETRRAATSARPETRARRPAARTDRPRSEPPRGEPAPPPPVSPVPPPPPRWVPLRAELERLVGSLARNHVILTTALCALVAAAVFAAFAATLFKPTETPPSAVATTAAIVVVTRAVPAEPTPTPRVRITATAEPWPPFPLDRPVPAGEQPNAGGADPAAVGNFLSRAGQDLGRGLLGGPRAPSTPVAPN